MILFIFLGLKMFSQNNAETKPKLVVGIVVDQMRWDFLYKYKARYGQGGFKRLVSQGFSCENTQIPYAPTVTAAGHVCIYTGSVPAIHGIAGNEWYDKSTNKVVYCADDSLSNTVGSKNESSGKMSPKNMWTNTITDELRIANNFTSKVVGVCIKDRGAIFPAGHSATAAYWYDGSNGNWITSTYYMKELPAWLEKMNKEKLPNKYYKKNWATLYPKETYKLSTADQQVYEGKYKGNPSSSLPYNLEGFIDNNYSIISSTPHGNSMTLEVAKAAIENHELGKSITTDFLALSLSSPDYIGHQFGPNSIEIEDTYLRLDAEIAEFLNYLDKKIGKGAYTVFLSADHGVAHIPGFLKQNKMPGEVLSSSKFIININEDAKEKYKIEDLIKSEQNYQLYLNNEAIKNKNLDAKEVYTFVMNEVKKYEGVLDVFLLTELQSQNLPDLIKSRLSNGMNARRSGDLQVLLKPAYFDGRITGTTHGSPYPYDSHIPMVWYGWGIKQGKSYKSYEMTDIAVTLAALLQIQMPNGAVGHVIDECLK